LRDRRDLPLGLFQRRKNLVRRFLIADFNILALVFRELRFENRRLARIQPSRESSNIPAARTRE